MTDKKQSIFLILSLAIITIFYITNAWVVDDAYITFRTVDNFINGYGLRWNVAERVQSYTHPLWMLVISAVSFFTNEVFYTSIGVSYLFVIGSILLFYQASQKDDKCIRTILLCALMLSSKSVFDYTSSGLENPLIYFLLICFYYTIQNNGSIAKLLFIASLGFITRQDTILLFAPYLLHAFLKSEVKGNLRFVLFAMLPAIIWEVFSLIYYGFPFPNTAYAKAFYAGNTILQHLEMGKIYLFESFIFDIAGACIAIFASALSFYKKDTKELSFLIGAWLYITYVIVFGAAGTHMAGRLFSFPIFLCIIIIASKLPLAKLRLVAIFLIVYNIIHPYAPVKAGTQFYRKKRVENGLVDTRSYAEEQEASLLSTKDYMNPPTHLHMKYGLKFKKMPEIVHIGSNHSDFMIGYFGYAAGPDKFIIDDLGLTDPILARLKPCDFMGMRTPGHYWRKIPEGYIASIKKGKNFIKDQHLYEYYKIIRIITRGKLFLWERLKHIFNINMGKYDYLIEKYIEANPIKPTQECTKYRDDLGETGIIK